MKLYLIVLLAVVIIASCSDDDNGTEPTVTESFEFPLAIGNEWTYGLYYLDENFNPTGDSLFELNLKVIDKLDYRGKSAYEVEKESSLIYKYYSVDNRAIYGHADYENLSSDGKNYYPDEWIKIYDFALDEWTMYSKNVSVVEDDYEAEGTIAMYGKKTGRTTTVIDGKEVDLYEFIAILSVEGTESSGGTTNVFSQKDTNYITFADGIGFYSIYNRAYEDDFFGSAELLHEYKLNN